MKTQKSSKLFYRDFTLMVIGQIISLFGNTILRFALPLYLLNQTGSPALLGIVSALSFIPAILLSPVGGIIADRVNKRNIMVILDFVTSGVVLLFLLLFGQVSLVPLMTVTMMALYGIQGAYSPAVQAAVPSMMEDGLLVKANSVVNLVQSLAQLIGPVVGGLLFGLAGLTPILYISVVCFFVSAVMEIFIRIPYTRKKSEVKMLPSVKADFAESIGFLRSVPVIGKGTMIVAGFNIFLTTMLMVGGPVIVTQVLPFEQALANQLYGYAEGALAVGGLLGGVLTGVFANKLKDSGMWKLLLCASICILPMAASLFLGLPAMVSYLVFTFSGLVLMAVATMFSIRIISFVQRVTPDELIGKIISLIMALAMCAQPIGQAMYGLLFQQFLGSVHYVLLFGAIVSGLIGIYSRRTFAGIDSIAPQKATPAPQAA